MSTEIGVRDLYNCINQSNGYGIQGYEVEKVYCDPLEQIKQREYAKIKKGEKSRQYETKKGSFLDDEARLHKFCPGPGTYKTEMDWPEKEKMKRNVGDKMTYIDEIIKNNKRNKLPAPGAYNVIKTLKELDKERKILAQKKVKPSDKISFLDEVQFESTTVPGPGNYNPRVRAKTENSISKMQKKPEDWRKIHGEKDKKKPEKAPDMRTYNPQPSFDLFETMSKKKAGKSVMDKVERFKTFGKTNTLPPTKYSVIQKWRGKADGKTKIERHGYESLSKGMSRSVYY